MYKNQKNSRTNCAFTLAEVLITLGIIGAVAALTMPTLMQNKNNNEIQAKVKKIYSTLTNADTMARSDDPNFNEGNLIKHLNVSKTCETGESGCFASSYSNLLICTGEYCGESDVDDLFSISNMQLNSHKSYVLTDGTAIVVQYNSGLLSYCKNNLNYYSCLGDIYVDINGAKEPNVTGRDLFSFAISPKDNVQILPFPKSACGETSPEKCSGQVIYGDLSYLNSFSNMKYDCYDNCAGSTQCNLVNK